MTKEFAVPPVVFPSGSNNPSSTGPHQRRVPTAPFQPPRSSNPSIPFMSFDIGSVTTSAPTATSYGGGGLISANFEDEEPLLDELGIHPEQIIRKTKSILNPFRINPTVHSDSDLSGPIILYLTFGLFQLLAGKIQFGVILGWIVVCSIFLYVVFNMLAGRNGNLNLHTCTSVIGYCMFPVVVLSAVSLFLPQSGMLRFGVAGVFVLWASRVCTALMVALADGGEEHRGLIAQDCYKPCEFKGHDQAADIEDEDDLFEINIEALKNIPPPHYWESYFTETGNALLANCLLPIADLSSAIPAVAPNSKAIDNSSLLRNWERYFSFMQPVP